MSATAPHLYLVGAHDGARGGLCGYLQQQGLRITTCGSAEEMLRRMHRLRPDLALLEAQLPGMSGLEACRLLRAEGDRLGLILLGAGDEIDRVLALEIGADDVMGRPFGPREVLARVRAVLRRGAGLPPLQRPRGVVRIGEHCFDAAARSLQCGAQRRVLGAVEYGLLAELAGNPKVALSRERLLAASHGQQPAVSARAVDAAVLRLRRLVEPDPARPRYIRTVRGRGYMFVPQP